MLWKIACAAAVLATSLHATPLASAQVPTHNAAKFAQVYAEIEKIFGGPEAFQKAFEDARIEQARMEAALQLSLNLEARFRANNSIKNADIYLNAANGLRTSVENLRTAFAKFDALDTALDETRAKAAYDRTTAEIAPIFERPMTEQFEYAKSLTLKSEPLRAVQTSVETLVAIARKPA